MGLTGQKRLGWVMLGLFALFMLGASVTPKLMGMEVAHQTLRDLGWPDGWVIWIGLMELVLTLLVLYPPTALLGATLMMALLGGAMATQVRAGSPLYSHQLFSLYLGVWMWAGLWLRDPRVRAVWPVVR